MHKCTCVSMWTSLPHVGQQSNIMVNGQRSPSFLQVVELLWSSNYEVPVIGMFCKEVAGELLAFQREDEPGVVSERDQAVFQQEQRVMPPLGVVTVGDDDVWVLVWWGVGVRWGVGVCHALGVGCLCVICCVSCIVCVHHHMLCIMLCACQPLLITMPLLSAFLIMSPHTITIMTQSHHHHTTIMPPQSYHNHTGRDANLASMGCALVCIHPLPAVAPAPATQGTAKTCCRGVNAG